MAGSAIIDRYGEFIWETFKRTRELAAHLCDAELREEITFHLATLERSKGVRPALVKAANESSRRRIPQLLDRAVAVQLVHEATLIIDDVLDDGRRRRGQDSVQARYGKTIATAVAGEFNVLALHLIDGDERLRSLARRLLRTYCVAESVQERERFTKRPLPIETWKEIALGDTGGIFRFAIELGGLSCAGAWPADQLAYLRHGLDDVEDLIERGGDRADVRDRAPTLVTCFTSGTTLKTLRKAIPAALASLKPSLSPGAARGRSRRTLEAFWPFFRDFDRQWAALSLARPVYLGSR